ncbi:globin family protein [Nitratireductor sp. XY-223]|uniref:globin family protein n=1 Tax=Nitratireductor sp. XY-223 TaxID=2561926 RepID=UPI0010AB2266|nr:globin family protein [Nitratireductor sp. XY-223]
MNRDQITIVQDTWQHVLPIAEVAADLFYDRLFELDPGVRDLFAKTDMSAQKAKLLATLASTIAGLNTSTTLLRDLEELGRKHAAYGVQPAHYAVVAEALIWTLEKGLGERWSDEAAKAWAAAYELIAGQMQKGANTHRNGDSRRAV